MDRRSFLFEATMTGVIATLPKFQFLNALGLPMSGGWLTSYLAGSCTLATTYQDAALSIKNTNPIELDSRGECLLWLDSTKNYKFELRNALGVLQWTVDNITNLQAITSALHAQLLENLAAPSGAEMIGYLPAGTDSISTTVQSKLNENVSVKDFGASASASDAVNTAAVQAAAATCLPFTLSGLTINLTASVTINNDIYGPGVLRRSGTMLSIGADGVSVDSVIFEGIATSGTSAPIAVFAINRSNLTVRNCQLKNCRVTVRNTALTRQSNFRLQNNKIDADFTLVEHIINQNDVITVRGIDGIWITDNNFTVLNVHRVLKIADTEAATTSGTDYRARNAFIANNRIIGSTDSNKQVLDLYFFTSDIAISHNLIQVTGFSSVIENKTGRGQNYNQNTLIGNNKISNDFTVISLQGSYGATTPGHDVGYQNAIIANNIITSTATSISGSRYPITTRFYHNIQISGNNVVTPLIFSKTTGLSAIRLLSNAYSTVNDNTITNGSISFSLATSNSAGDSFISTMLSIICSGNTVNNFGGSGTLGGIEVVNTRTASLLQVLISANYIKQDVDATIPAGCIGVSGSTFATLLVSNNIGVMANTVAQRLRVLSSTIQKVLEDNNSWNQIGWTSVAYAPPSIAAGGLTTTTLNISGSVVSADVVSRVSFSRALAGTIITAWVSAEDTVTVQFYNPTAGAVNLSSGTLTVEVTRKT